MDIGGTSEVRTKIQGGDPFDDSITF